VRRRGGYEYTTDAPLSARLANRRLTEASVGVADFAGKRVLDVGCGDGTYTLEIATRCGTKTIEGIDPAPEAIEAARARHAGPGISYEIASAYELPYDDLSFELAYLRGVLHHMDRPAETIREALRVAPRIVVVEPNGYSPALKLIERFSPYHREHAERSYSARRLDDWVRDAGASVERRTWVGLVPMFAPDWVAKTAKRVEPLVERTPGLRAIGCAVYVFSASCKGAV